MDKQARAIRIIELLRRATKNMVPPASLSIINTFGKDPYLVLISCLLSLRTKDTVSLPASIRLFGHAKTPLQMLALPTTQIEKIIYPTGFYRKKALLLHAISHQLITEFNGKVPDTLEALLSLNGVGRKTANLVLGVAFDIPAICVDTHVHKVSNRLGLVKSKTTQETEQQLMELLPKEYWIEYNHLIVVLGQNICVPVSPFCSKCAISDLCPRIGVVRHR